jgi:hypothetical protein
MNERQDSIALTLCLWASAIHHKAGAAEGHPNRRDATHEPAQAHDIERYLLRHRAKTEPDVLSAIEAVERTLLSIRAPEWFRAYLLFKYPIVGRYEPRRRTGTRAARFEDTAVSFVSGGHFQDVVGTLRTRQLRHESAKLISAVERAFNVQLIRETANCGQAPA